MALINSIAKIISIFYNKFLSTVNKSLKKAELSTEKSHYTTQNLLRITFSTVCYFCVFVINMKIDLKE